MKSTLPTALILVSMAGLVSGWSLGKLFTDKKVLALKSRDLPPLPTACVVNGTVYEEGERFNMGPCNRCICERGDVYHCMATMCDAPPCADANFTESCCGTCPNGPNCRGPKGRPIQIGEEFPPTLTGSRCTCERVGMRAGISCAPPVLLDLP